MPLLRNIAGVPGVGLINEPSAQDTMRLLTDEGGGSGGPSGYYLPADSNQGNPDGAGGNSGAIEIPKEGPGGPAAPVYPVEPIQPIYSDEVVNQLPEANQAPVIPPAPGSGKLLPLLALGSLVLTMTGLHPFKKVGTTLLFAGSLALLYFEFSQADKQPAGVQEPNTL